MTTEIVSHSVLIVINRFLPIAEVHLGWALFGLLVFWGPVVLALVGIVWAFRSQPRRLGTWCSRVVRGWGRRPAVVLVFAPRRADR